MPKMKIVTRTQNGVEGQAWVVKADIVSVFSGFVFLYTAQQDNPNLTSEVVAVIPAPDIVSIVVVKS